MKMPVLASKLERQRAEYLALAQHYRRIGPAAVLAAVQCVARKRPSEQRALQTPEKR